MRDPLYRYVITQDVKTFFEKVKHFRPSFVQEVGGIESAQAILALLISMMH